MLRSPEFFFQNAKIFGYPISAETDGWLVLIIIIIQSLGSEQRLVDVAAVPLGRFIGVFWAVVYYP